MSIMPALRGHWIGNTGPQNPTNEAGANKSKYK